MKNMRATYEARGATGTADGGGTRFAQPRRRSVFAAAGVAALAAALATPGPVQALTPLSVSREFAERLDLSAVRLIAVQEDGRFKTLDTLAREKLKYIDSSREARSIDPVLRLFDMLLVPQHYYNEYTIYIRKKPLRQAIVQGIRSTVPADQRTGAISDAELERIMQTGYVRPATLDHPAVRRVLAALERDLMRTNKDVRALYGARNLSDPQVMHTLLRIIPPPGATSEIDPWYTWQQAWAGGSGVPDDATHAGLRGEGIPDLDPEVRKTLQQCWADLSAAWRTQDAERASAALNTLAATLPTIRPDLYPPLNKRAWEHWYYKHNKLTGTWIIYFAALPFLLMAVVYRQRWARWTGLVLFTLGFGLHTFATFLRWWIAGRIPNANMFEAVTASAWFGCLVALVLEIWLRRRPMRNLFALAASTYAMAALMAGHFMPIALNSDITTIMPVLDRTIWLYIHTNIVIASYALIFFAAVTATIYLLIRGLRALVASPRLVALWEGRSGAVPVPGGAASVILTSGSNPGHNAPDDEGFGLARTLDGATMIFLELAFITLWAGTILGAVWADVSWGRPWGWDPKEVFALNTWLVFLILVHIRLQVRDKALWTAVLAIIGCAVMLFNWIAVNFVIVGLHSYA